MKLAFFGPVLNHHQAPVADELYKILGDDFKFIELSNCHDSKGCSEDFSIRPYLIRRNDSTLAILHSIAKNADVCVFAGYEALPYQIERLKLGKLAFDMGERWLKRGLINLLSPRIAAMVASYHLRGWHKKPVYKLCCSAFAANDCNILGAYKGRCFKWGYFTKPHCVDVSTENADNIPVSIMWCARFLKLKHPEIVLEMARKLKKKGYKFHLDMYGDEDSSMPQNMIFPKSNLVRMIDDFSLGDYVTLKGNQPNDKIIQAMRSSDIFLFTSDRNEGWGAVANESMSCECTLVASDAIGSVPYLIEDGKTGLIFKDGNVDCLTDKVEWLLNNKDKMKEIGKSAAKSLRELWSPENAAISLLKLIYEIETGRRTSILTGPCSQA